MMVSVYLKWYNSAMAKRRRRRRLRAGRLTALILILALLAGVFFFALSLLFRAVSGIFHQAPAPMPAEPTPTPDPIYKNDYDWSNVTVDENGFAHYEDEQYVTRTGIDVSHYQGTIDWNAVHEAGVEFAFIRAGYRGHTTGELHEDTGFRENMQKAGDAGVEVAVYFFSQAADEQEAIEEAEYAISLVKDDPVKVIAYDLEIHPDGRLSDTTQDANTAAAEAFCRTVRENGYTPLVYGSVSFLCTEVRMSQLQDITPFWLAWYDDKEPPFPYAFMIWQYSCEGTLPGIETAVDMNMLFVKK